MHKTFIIIILTIAIGAPLITKLSIQDKFPNYLYMDAMDFKQHRISQLNQGQKENNRLIFLGSSAVAGSNVPPATTVSDYFNQKQDVYESFNLATLQGTMIEIFTYFVLVLEHNPKSIIVGLSPGNFSQLGASLVVKKHFDLIKPFLSESMASALKKDIDRKFFMPVFFYKPMDQRLPPKGLLSFRTKLNQLKNNLFGNRFSSTFSGHSGQYLGESLNPDNRLYELLTTMKKECDKRNIKLLVYLEPIVSPETIYGENFDKYLTVIKNHLTKINVKFFDYSNEIPSTHDYFIDFIHMRPVAYEQLAEKLISDINRSSF